MKDDSDPEMCLRLLMCPNIDENGQENLHDMLALMQHNARKHVPDGYMDYMRSYLVVKFFNNRFPWNSIEGNVVAGYLYCVLPYALIQLLVWMQVRVAGNIDENEVKRIIYSVERYLDHNQRIYKILSDHTELLRLDDYLDCVLQL